MTTSLPSTPFIAKAANPDKPSFHRNCNDFTQPVVADTLVVFDSRLQDLEILYKALLPNTIGCTLTTQDHALEAIARLLQQTGAKQLAIMAHGEPGVVHLGAKAIDLAALEESAGLLRAWGVESIDLYACEVGANQEFVAKFSELTGARVAAAAYPVGSESLGGSWELADSGPVPFALERLASYGGILAILTESVNGNASDGYINLSEVGTSFTVTGTANNVGTTGTTAQGNQVLFAIYSDSTLLYWKVTNIVGGFYSSGSINLNTIIGANNLNTFQGSLQLKVYQGAGGTNNSSGSYSTADTSPTPPTFNFNRSGSATLAAGTTAGLYASVPSIILDTIAPSSSAPGIPDLISDTGFSSTDNITNVALPTFTVGLTGTGAVAGDRIQLFRNTNLYASQVLSQADIDATVVTVIATNPINTGTISARIADAAGNVSTSASVTPFTVTIDTIAPVKTVTAIDVVGAQTITATLSAALAAAVASVSAEQLWASTDNGTTWTNITSFVSDTNVSWATTLSGSSTILMEVRDTAGNIGPATSKTYAIDTTPPAPPTFNLANDSGSSSSDGITNIGIVNVSDIEANATWQYSTNGGSTWSAAQPAAITSFTLAAGTYAAGAIKVRQTDPASNNSTIATNSLAIGIDTSAPTAISPASASLNENNAANAIVATLSATDTGAGSGNIAFSLVPGQGDNSEFNISGNNLRINTPTNAEVKSSYSVVIRATDAAGNYTDFTRTIAINDVNEAPTLTVAGTATSLSENTSTITRIKVADITISDVDGGVNLLSLGGVDAATFEIDGAELFLKAGTVLDFEAKPSYNVNILLDDSTIGSTPEDTQSFTLTITDATEPTISINDVTIVEGLGGTTSSAILTVSLSSTWNQNVSVQYLTNGVSATANTDYTTSSGTITFAPGQTSQTINIPIINDDLNELNETIAIVLSNPVNAVISDDTGVVTITDTLTTSISTVLPSLVENLTLTGVNDITGIDNGGNNIITGNDGNNYIEASLGDDTINGGGGNDILRDYGDTADTLIGGNGDDDIYAGGGVDRLEGGDGNDIYYLSYLATDNDDDIIIENVGEGADTACSLFTVNALVANVENLVLIGGGNISGVGNILNNYIVGNYGDNVLDGGDGDDLLRDYGGTADTLIGGNGDDNLYAAGGIDRLEGGDGNDTYYLSYLATDNDDDIIIENVGEGADTACSLFTVNALAANVENLVLIGGGNIGGVGNSLNNYIVGNNGDNVLDGGGGDDLLRDYGGTADTLIGGNGDDNLYAAGGIDRLEGGDGNDTYYLSYLATDNDDDIIIENVGEGADTACSLFTVNALAANVENLVLIGTGNINGVGNSLNNYIAGNSGGNTLVGGAGNDTLVGGGGSNQFEFSLTVSSSTGITTSLGIDTIADFVVGTDKIVLNNVSNFAPSPLHFAVVANDAIASTYTGDAIVLYSTGSGRLYYNADDTIAGLGAAGGNFAILSNNPQNLSANDVMVNPIVVA